MTNSCRRRTSKVLLRLGQILLLSGIICFTISIATAYWVIRSEVSVVASMDCGSLLDNLNFINVMALQGMIMFAGEIKNKAERLPGQDAETPGWSFAVAVAGLTLSIFGLLLATMFRDLPVTSPAESGGSCLRPASRSPTIHAVVR
ncbi:unnamed protein product [Candidula unifasciata]|uniref:Uncharacterized protein n=1 Tax=Candidula unifasciata TaxID=100452 RepID=A0A8S3YK78_9EUPU|nr:unnamed protein product [Candidula unifasciata]